QLGFAAPQTEAVKLQQAVDRLVEQQGKAAAAVSARAAEQIRSGRILLIALSILALVAAGLIAWLYVGRNIVSRLAHLSSAMLAIAAGRRENAVSGAGGGRDRPPGKSRRSLPEKRRGAGSIARGTRRCSHQAGKDR